MSLIKPQVGTKFGILRRSYSRRGRAELQRQYPKLTEGDICDVLDNHAKTLKEATVFTMFQTWIHGDLRKKAKEKD